MILRLTTLFVLPWISFCYDSESSEGNKIEMSPLYNTIIFGDVADIINDFENNNPLYTDILFGDSESDENLEDLLSEYQHYLEKAHKERENYLENKSKNKVPPLRHDKFTKVKSSSQGKFSNIFYEKPFYNPMATNFLQDSFDNPTEAFFSLRNIMNKNFIKDDATSTASKVHEELIPREKQTYDEKVLLSVPPVMPHSVSERIKSACYCKNGILPCECDCKQCLMPWEVLEHNNMEPTKILDTDKPYLSYPLINDNFGREPPGNAFNIRIKVDLQFPKSQELASKYSKLLNQDKTAERPEFNSKEFIETLPSPYFNFPIPMDIFGISKSLKVGQHEPLHKLSMHKRKKSKQNSNKKHRKKLITIHNYKIEPLKHQLINTQTVANVSIKVYNESKTLNITTTEPTLKETDLNFTTNKIENVNEIHTDKNIYVTVNISNTGDKNTDDTHKSENSIETDFTKTASNKNNTLPTKVRVRRQVAADKKANSTKSKTNEAKAIVERFHKSTSANLKESGHLTKVEKDLFTDAELLFWPNCHNVSTGNLKNITTLILENEHKKSKLNISKGSIHQNHTTLLEQAIFGHVNWSDVDAVTPAFMSFVGKYLQGVLTFCSGNACHSMNCAQKTCFHRACQPAQRLNNRGHCMGSNSTDSVASMESIMDLPSNVAFEIVDILENKMLGNLFGKATLCINSKCITFIASKKYFTKSRCSVKGLDTIGHCLNAKNEKII